MPIQEKSRPDDAPLAAINVQRPCSTMENPFLRATRKWPYTALKGVLWGKLIWGDGVSGLSDKAQSPDSA
jgi:hypothetical protein